MQTLERFFTNPAISATDVNQVIAFRQLDIFAFLIFNQRKFQIGIIDHRENGIWSVSNLARSSQYCFHLCRTHMRTLAIQIMQLLPIKTQPGGLLHKPVKRVLRYCQDFWLDVGGNG